MKIFVLFKNVIAKLSLLFTFFISTTSVFSQIIPELVFANHILESGVAGEDGAKYRFTNVATNLDAVVEIRGRSSASVVLGSIDTIGTGLGYSKAFQPVLGIQGTAPANTTWSMDFRITFYNAGTNSPQDISEFAITGLDIDGDGSTLNEWTRMEKIFSMDTSLVNSLSLTQLAVTAEGKDYKIDGIIVNSPGIDTFATNVMATYTYHNKNTIDFTIGANTSFSVTSAGMRLNSLWFKQFDMTQRVILPVKLASFTATLNNTKADLKWTTASEINVSHFVIEKSLDGTNFTDAGLMFAYGNATDKTNYSFSDNLSNTTASVVYYRLRSIDIDGKSELSATRIIRIGKVNENTITIVTYPNPVSNEVRITIPVAWQNKKVVYELFSANGQPVKKTQTANSSQTENLNISSLAPGFYIVKVTCEGQTALQKIIKQ